MKKPLNHFTVRVETPSMSRQFTYQGSYASLVRKLTKQYPATATVSIKE